MSAGYYSVIQYCPDRARAEAVNVGVVLMVPDREFIKARTAHGNDRVRRLFSLKGDRLEHLNSAKQAFEARFEVEGAHFRSAEDLVRFAATRGNELILTPPRSIKVDDPEAELGSLFDELVGGRARKEPKPKLIELDEVFMRLRKTNPHVLIRQSFEVSAYKKVKADYAYQNGTLNLVRVHSFNADEDLQAAARLGAEGLLIRKHGVNDQPAKEIVVSSTAHEIEQRVRALLKEFGVEFVPRQEVPRFAARVEQEAH